MSKYVIGLDFGSDSVRCLVADASDGAEMSTAVVEYARWKNGEYCNPGKLQYRQHPLDHIEAMERCIRKALEPLGAKSSDVAGISIDATASTPVLVDREGTPLALLPGFENNPDAMFVLWKDHTAIAEADRINEIAHSREPDFTRFSGGTYSCEWVWAKMLHCLRNSPELQARTYSWTEHGDWITGLLAGNVNPLTMARSRCLAGHKAMWHESWGGLPPMEFLVAVDPVLRLFESHLFSETVTCGRKVGGLCPEWAARLGLKEGIAVGVGAIDCHVGAVGAGIVPGTLVKVMGTSTCDLAVCTYDAIGSRALRGICGQVDGSILPGYIGFEAGQSSFGDVYAWFGRFSGRSIEDLTSEAEKLPLTEDDIVSTDWFNGRRSPDADPRRKGTISGLTIASTPAQVFKSLVEATAFGSRAINERFEEEGVTIERIIAVGGISKKSRFVMQTMADVMGMPVSILDTDQACALGAAMFAACAAGLYPDVETAQKAMQAGFCDEYLPDSARTAIYEVLYSKYRGI